MNTAIGFIRDDAVLLALSSEQAEAAATMLYCLVYVKTVYTKQYRLSTSFVLVISRNMIKSRRQHVPPKRQPLTAMSGASWLVPLLLANPLQRLRPAIKLPVSSPL
jgi:hypothetical protein